MNQSAAVAANTLYFEKCTNVLVDEFLHCGYNFNY